MRLVRVFPRQTRATPDDELAFFGPPRFDTEADEVHVDVTFTADKPHAEWLAEQWKGIAPVKIGGVAYGDSGNEFIPGRYIRHGYTFTSRGCPERCWYCSVWKRDPKIRLLPIQDGWNILDDNLLACPEDHFRSVIDMLSRQKRRVEFTGGLQASRLRSAVAGNGEHRIHAIRNVVATGDTKRREVEAETGVEKIPEELGASGYYPRANGQRAGTHPIGS
jgi:hypothetical protein